MLEFLAHLFITAALLMLVSNYVKGVSVSGWGPALLGALVLGIVNALVRPVMVLLTLPITIITFGLFLLVINALMLWLVAALVPGIKIQKFGSAFLGALLLAVLNSIIHWMIG
ncbi:phage holin family protein [Planctomicrobium piriforme]|uniref:Putative membrane protein n=1 Tax=Planctomicrobium piriforme TaxID=1576369 RepID=A0A1I3SZ49_9PLAN|nr:phage holin family protein [Planctomicrobium piriforme]SFJ63532.1 putative membrane protein [Planctomicrobium piriforme]